jgi:hypothetical protein
MVSLGVETSLFDNGLRSFERALGWKNTNGRLPSSGLWITINSGAVTKTIG